MYKISTINSNIPLYAILKENSIILRTTDIHFARKICFYLNNDKDIIKDFDGEPFCGDGICDDDMGETQENCPQDCIEGSEAEDDFEENYDNIMAEMKDIIPEIPEEEKHLDITYFVTVYPTCYLDAGTSLANYMEDISYDEFIWYGIPLKFQYDTRWGTLRTGVGGESLYLSLSTILGINLIWAELKKIILLPLKGFT